MTLDRICAAVMPSPAPVSWPCPDLLCTLEPDTHSVDSPALRPNRVRDDRSDIPTLVTTTVIDADPVVATFDATMLLDATDAPLKLSARVKHTRFRPADTAKDSAVSYPDATRPNTTLADTHTVLSVQLRPTREPGLAFCGPVLDVSMVKLMPPVVGAFVATPELIDPP